MGVEKRTIIAATAAAMLIGLMVWLTPLLPANARVWGVDAFVFLPVGYRIGLTLAAIVFAVLSIAAIRDNRLADNSLVPMSLPLLALVVLFFLPPATAMRGDGQLLLDALVFNRLLPLRAPLTSIIANSFYQTGWFPGNPEGVFRILGNLGFILQSIALYLLIRQWNDATRRWTASIGITFTGLLLVYAGIPEYYSLSLGMAALGLALSMKPIEEDRYPIAGFVVLLVAVFLHYQSIVLFPAFLLLLQRKMGRRNSWLLFGGVSLAAFVLAMVFLGDHLLAPFGPRVSDGYSFFSLRHLLDSLNQFFWAIPATLVLVISLLFADKGDKEKGNRTDFLLAATLGALGFAFLFIPDLGMARDADLLVLFAVPATFLLSSKARRFDHAALPWIAGMMIFAGVMVTGSQLTVQAKESPSVERYVRLLRLDPGRSSAFGWEFLGQHLMERGDYEEAKGAINMAWKMSKNPRYAIFMASINQQLRHYAEAEEWARIGTAAFPDRTDAQLVLARALYLQGKYREAVEPLSITLNTGLFDQAVIVMLADSFMKTSQPQKAMSLLTNSLRSGLAPNGNIVTLLAEAQEALGEIAIAGEIFSDALKMNPQEPFKTRAREGLLRTGYVPPENE